MTRVLVILVLALGLAPTARAQSPQGLDEEARKAKAADYYAEAQAAFDGERYEEAITLFRLADRFYPSPVIDYNIAKAYERLSRYEDAIAAYESYLSRYQKERGVEPPDSLDVKKTLAFLKQLARKEVPEVTIDSDPPGANVHINDRGTIVGQTPFVSRLEKGSYEITLTIDGYRDLTKIVEVTAEAPARFLFRLDKIQTVGTLDVAVTVKDARIHVDGKVVGLSPLPPLVNTEFGERQIVVEKEGYGSFRAMANVRANETTRVLVDLSLEDKPSSFRSYLGWPLVVTGVLGMGAGITFWQLADREWNTTQTFRDYRLYQNLGYGLGGGLIAAGFGLLIWEWTRDAVDEDDLLPADKSAPAATLLRRAPLALPGLATRPFAPAATTVLGD